MSDFAGLDLIEPLRRALSAEAYTEPTPIQSKAIPHLLSGRDLIGVAQTGAGKTAAFSLPLLQALKARSKGRPAPGRPRALILAPTRELAVQIGDSLRSYGRHLPMRTATLFGGTPIGRQIRELSRGVDIVVATPGRLLDLMNQNKLRLNAVEVFVLDEADRMLDMGFIADVRKISRQVPAERQTVLFSATMSPAVTKLAGELLSEPVRVEVAAQSTTAERIEQSVLFVEKNDKRRLLSALLKDGGISRALVFARTKHGADRIARHLGQSGVGCGVIHSNKSQNARQAALTGFKDGRLPVLVATDIAARGIDVDGVSHVINFDLPNMPETYVHRIGRTARAGAAGTAISFCAADERAYLDAIEKTIRMAVAVDDSHPFHAPAIAAGQTVSVKAVAARGRKTRHRANNDRGDVQARQSQRPNTARRSKPRRTRRTGQQKKAA